MKKYNTVVELLSSKNRWCQDQLRDYDDEGNLLSCCIEGAIIEVYKDDLNAMRDASIKVRSIIGTHRIFQWNDDPHRTHKEVVEMVTKANI